MSTNSDTFNAGISVTEKLAYLYLKSIFKEPSWREQDGEDHQDSKLVLRILKKHPNLTKAWFAGHEGETQYRPLSHLLAAGAPLDIVQQAHQLNPNGLWVTSPSDGCLPLHHAARWGCSFQVVTWLLELHPDAAACTVVRAQMSCRFKSL